MTSNSHLYIQVGVFFFPCDEIRLDDVTEWKQDDHQIYLTVKYILQLYFYLNLLQLYRSAQVAFNQAALGFV